MPTSALNTYSNTTVDPIFNPDDAMASMLSVAFAVSSTLAAGTVVGKVTSGGKYRAYASGNADGSQIPVGILRRAVTTDGSGNITNQDEWGATFLTNAIYTQGTFLIAQLTGLDDNAVTVLKAHTDGNLVANSTIVVIGG